MSSTSEVPAGDDAQGVPEPPFTAGRFTGRTAIVTGAGSGIGRATALRLAREGARVVIADIAAGRLEQLTAEFPGLDHLQVRARRPRLGPIMQTTVPSVATAEQLAATITWLLSDDVSNVNGAILPSDGGWSAL